MIILRYKEKEKRITIECWDWDRIGSDEYMGEFTVDVDNLPENKEVVQWYDLGHPPEKSKRKSGKVSGAIHLGIEKVAE